MLLNNYFALYKTMICGYSNGTSDQVYGGVHKCRPIMTSVSGDFYAYHDMRHQSLCGLGNGIQCGGYNDILESGKTKWWEPGAYIYLQAGDGTADVTLDDYKLSGNVIPLTKVASEVITNVVENKLVTTHKMTVRNDATDSVTVNEYGWISYFAAPLNGTNFSPYSGGTIFPVMFERTKLDTPITMASGETASFELVFETPLPIN